MALSGGGSRKRKKARRAADKRNEHAITRDRLSVRVKRAQGVQGKTAPFMEYIKGARAALRKGRCDLIEWNIKGARRVADRYKTRASFEKAMSVLDKVSDSYFRECNISNPYVRTRRSR